MTAPDTGHTGHPQAKSAVTIRAVSWALLAMLLLTFRAARLQLDSRNLLQCMALLTSFLGGLLSLLLLRSSRVAHR